MTKPKILVIGLDGGSWKLLETWVKEGKLPNLENIIKNGVYGDLRSVIPTLTCPAWKSYSTGKLPANLGAFGFSRIDWEEQAFTPLRFQFSTEQEIWDYLNLGGFTAGVINTPLTYPPKRIDGFMISGPMTPGEDKEYTHTKKLKVKLKQRYNYRISPKYTFYIQDLLENEEISKHVRKNVKTKFKVARDFSQKVDFSQITIFRTDNLEHRFWDGKEVEDLWKLIDNEIGKIIKDNPKTNIFIMSDHGMDKTKIFFNLGAWLQKHDYCRSAGEKRGSTLNKLGITRDLFFGLIRKLNLRGLMERFLRVLPPEVTREAYRKIPGMVTGEKLDWNKSKIIPSGNMLYLNPSLDNKESVKKALQEELLKIKSPESGEKIIKAVYEKEEVFQGKYLEIAPDLVVIPSEGVCIKSKIGEKMWSEDITYWIANHTLDGIFLGYGPDIKKNEKINGAQLVDLAPTILHAFGLPVPDGMDGKVLKMIFKEESEPGKTPVKRQKIEASKKEIKSKIKKLKHKGKV